MDDAHQWPSEKSNAESPERLFSFLYGGQPSSEFLKTWDVERTENELDEHRTERTITYTDTKNRTPSAVCDGDMEELSNR